MRTEESLALPENGIEVSSLQIARAVTWADGSKERFDFMPIWLLWSFIAMFKGVHIHVYSSKPRRAYTFRLSRGVFMTRVLSVRLWTRTAYRPAFAIDRDSEHLPEPMRKFIQYHEAIDKLRDLP